MRIYWYLLLIIIITLLYKLTTDIIYQEGYPYYKDKDVILPDMGFKLIRNYQHISLVYKIKEFFTFIIICFFIISNLTNNEIIKEYLINVLVLQIIRISLFTSTILPDPSKKCSCVNLLKLGDGGCYDLVISGHCILLFPIIWIVLQKKLYNSYIRYIIIFINFIIVYLMLSLRQHYTIDIINALFYSFLINSFIKNY